MGFLKIFIVYVKHYLFKRQYLRYSTNIQHTYIYKNKKLEHKSDFSQGRIIQNKYLS